MKLSLKFSLKSALGIGRGNRPEAKAEQLESPEQTNDSYQPSREEIAEDAFYDGVADGARLTNKIQGAFLGASVAFGLGAAAVAGGAVLGPALMLGTGAGMLALGALGCSGMEAVSDEMGHLGSRLDKNYSLRGEALARSGLAVGLNVLAGGSALVTTGILLAEGLLSEAFTRFSTRKQKPPN